MRSIADTRRDNLRQLIDTRFEGSQTRLGQAVGLAPSLVSRLISDRPSSRKNIGHRLARRIEAALALPDNQLDEPPRELPAQDRESPNEKPPLSSRPRFFRGDLGSLDLVQPHFDAPLVTPEQLAVFGSIPAARERATGLATVPLRISPAPRSVVALRLTDDAMDERFPSGSIIVITDERSPRPGEFVVGILPKAREACLRQWVAAADRIFLVPLNRSYQALEVSPDYRLCGVAIEATVFW